MPSRLPPSGANKKLWKHNHRLTHPRSCRLAGDFFAYNTLLTATNLGLFTLLAKSRGSGRDIQKEPGLHSRSPYDFIDTLVALGFSDQTGIKETSVYSNAPDSDLFLDKNKPSYVGGILEMANNRLFHFWNDLEEGLKTGLPQCETKHGGRPFF